MQTLGSRQPDINELVDIQNVIIDSSLPVAEKQMSFIKQIKNPCCFRFGDMTIRTSFLNAGPTMQDRLKQYLLSGQGMELFLT